LAKSVSFVHNVNLIVNRKTLHIIFSQNETVNHQQNQADNVNIFSRTAQSKSTVWKNFDAKIN